MRDDVQEYEQYPISLVCVSVCECVCVCFESNYVSCVGKKKEKKKNCPAETFYHCNLRSLEPETGSA